MMVVSVCAAAQDQQGWAHAASYTCSMARTSAVWRGSVSTGRKAALQLHSLSPSCCQVLQCKQQQQQQQHLPTSSQLPTSLPEPPPPPHHHHQELLLQHISAETLLVGHALENDLQALRLLHAKVVDTAIMFPHPRGPPYKSALKVLAERFLRRSIQQGEHDSTVDARTALDLAVLKINHGPSFGTPEAQATDKLVDVVAAHGHRSCLVDRQDVLRRFASSAASAVPAFDDKHCMAELVKQLAPRKHSLVWGQLMGLQHFYYERCQQERRRHEREVGKAQGEGDGEGQGQGEPDGKQQHGVDGGGAHSEAKQQQHQQEQQEQQQADDHGDQQQQQQAGSTAAAAAAAAAAEGDYSDERLQTTARQLDEHIGKVYDALPPNSMLIVATGQGDTAECRRQQELKYRRQNRLDGLPPWSQAAEEQFHELCDEVMRGLCFAAVKQ
jgi:hypothetical protein